MATPTKSSMIEPSYNSYLIVLALVMIAWSFTQPPSETLQDAVLKSLPSVALMFLIVTCSSYPSGPFLWPHPLLWKFVFGVTVLYLLIVIAFLFMTTEQMRSFLHIFDPKLITNDDFAHIPPSDCTFTFENFLSKVDIFAIAHVLGHAAKAMCIQDRFVLWLLSISWEAFELHLDYAIPDFVECWWDQVFLDIFISNAIGIELGLFFNRHFYTDQRQYKWNTLSSLQRFLQVQLMLLVFLLVELNAFFLKTDLHVPTNHRWNTMRLFMFAVIGLPSVHQWYQYIVDSKATKLGAQCIIVSLLIIAETALCFKIVGPVLFNPPSKNVRLMFIGGVAYVVIIGFLLLRQRNIQSKEVVHPKSN